MLKIKADRYFFPAFPAPFFFFNTNVFNTIHDLSCWDCPRSNKKYMIAYFRLMYATSYKDYIDVPDYIAEKVQNGQMNIAVFSDYIRLALLKRYGGIWLDSTFYVNRDFPREIDNMSFYTINQGNKRKWVVTRDRWSVCLLACAPNNPLISFCEEFLREYWKNETTPVAYLMTDCIIGIAYDEIPFFKKMIDSVPINNTHCFDFLEVLIYSVVYAFIMYLCVMKSDEKEQIFNLVKHKKKI